MDRREQIADELTAARQRSLDLLSPLADETLVRQHSPLMSPLVWDLAHVGNYEDQWLLRRSGARGVGDRWDDLYDAFLHPRRDRPSLPILGPAAARTYIAEVRHRVLDVLDRATDLDDNFLYGMVVQHEHQHDETMLATLQLMDGDGYGASTALSPVVAGMPLPEDVLVPAGRFVMGTDSDPWAYDNERSAHEVDLPAFRIDTTPVTNGAYAEFVADGGYAESRWWTPEGWSWRQEAGLEHPEFWLADGGGDWCRLRFGAIEPLPADQPVQHVCWYEADAYARWRGKRLPTEAEWEKAASWDAATNTKRRYSWGDEPPRPVHANLAGLHRSFEPAPVTAHPAGAGPVGCLAMMGDVWEWTASDFSPYPGFRAFPYREYSEVFFGSDHKVLRGGSWATHPTAVRTTFRNWDYPIRRQIFAGFRCAREA